MMLEKIIIKLSECQKDMLLRAMVLGQYTDDIIDFKSIKEYPFSEEEYKEAMEDIRDQLQSYNC